MSVFILLHSKTSHTGFLLLVPGWKPRHEALLSAGSGQTAQLINLLRVCPLLADVRIAGLSPSLLQEHLQGGCSLGPLLGSSSN